MNNSRVLEEAKCELNAASLKYKKAKLINELDNMNEHKIIYLPVQSAHFRVERKFSFNRKNQKVERKDGHDTEWTCDKNRILLDYDPIDVIEIPNSELTLDMIDMEFVCIFNNGYYRPQIYHSSDIIIPSSLKEEMSHSILGIMPNYYDIKYIDGDVLQSEKNRPYFEYYNDIPESMGCDILLRFKCMMNRINRK